MRLRTALLFAMVGGGVPSTVVAVVGGDDLLMSTRAAGTLLVSDSASPAVRLLSGGFVHAAISTFWTSVLWHVLPRRHTVVWGAAGGLAIAALDLGLIGRRYPAINRLARGPQVADHLAFGLIVGGCRAVVHGRTDPAGTLAAL